MKQHKSAENIDLNAKKPLKNNKLFSQAISILRNNKGVNLIELMVTASIGFIVSMGIASVFIFVMEQFTVLVERNTAEENSIMTTYYLRNFLGQAVDVYAVTAVDPVSLLALNGGGQIDYNFDLLTTQTGGAVVGSGNNGEFARFAVFNREAGTYNSNSGTMVNGGSQLRPTGIFVKDTEPPSPNPDASSAMAVFDINSTTGSMTPGPSDLHFSRLHNLRVQRVPAGAGPGSCPGGFAVELVIETNGTVIKCVGAGWTPTPGVRYRVKTITLEVVTRHFKTADKSNWNYRVPIGGGTTSPYNDILQTVKVNLKNNVLTRESLTGDAGAEERVHGSLYFYDYVIPSIIGN